MSEIGVADSARNNAAWCDAVCRAHDRPGEFCQSYWLNPHPTPSLYPNLITLDASFAPAWSAVRTLEQARPSPSWAVKDSFGVLALGRAGFNLLFEAEWILRPVSSAPRRIRSPAVSWLRIRSESTLGAWEAAWGESVGHPRVFLPALLTQDDIAVIAAVGQGDVITAGVIAIRTDNVVGLSNLFVRGAESQSLRAGCIEAAMDTFPGLPLVGYEARKDVAELHPLGFRSLGSLRVWIREPGPPQPE